MYSGSGSGYKFLEFRIRIQPLSSEHIWKLFLKTHLKFILKEESTNYLPFSISYYTPTVQTYSNYEWCFEILFLSFCSYTVYTPGVRVAKTERTADPTKGEALHKCIANF